MSDSDPLAREPGTLERWHAMRQTLVGRTITEVRRMTDGEKDREYWEEARGESAVVLVLDSGLILYPSRDEEGNGPGALFGMDVDGEMLRFLDWRDKP